jgi:hypothetical protein
MIERLKTYVESHIHPLELLHIRLSLLSVSFRQGKDVMKDLEQLITEYNSLGVLWPCEYVKALKAGDFAHPKRF